MRTACAPQSASARNAAHVPGIHFASGDGIGPGPPIPERSDVPDTVMRLPFATQGRSPIHAAIARLGHPLWLALCFTILPLATGSAQGTAASSTPLSMAQDGRQPAASAPADTEDANARAARPRRRAARQALPAADRDVGGFLRPTLVWRRPAMLATLLALTAALLLALPVVAVYRWTTPPDRYDPALAQSVFILPATVAGIVLVIQGSLALAFSLAGVVTTVRFRSALKDTNNAAYIFMAVAIGVAAGAEAVDIAAVLALFFSVAMILLYIARSRVLERGKAVPQVPAAGKHQGTKHPDAVPDAARDDHHADLLVQAPSADVAQHLVEPLLTGMAKSWTLLRVVPDSAGATALTYEVRLRKHGDPLELARAITLAGEDHQIVASVWHPAEPDAHTSPPQGG